MKHLLHDIAPHVDASSWIRCLRASIATCLSANVCRAISPTYRLLQFGKRISESINVSKYLDLSIRFSLFLLSTFHYYCISLLRKFPIALPSTSSTFLVEMFIEVLEVLCFFALTLRLHCIGRGQEPAIGIIAGNKRCFT